MNQQLSPHLFRSLHRSWCLFEKQFDKQVRALANLYHLEDLNLASSRSVGAEGLGPLTKLTRLTNVRLSFVNDQGVSGLPCLLQKTCFPHHSFESYHARLVSTRGRMNEKVPTKLDDDVHGSL